MVSIFEAYANVYRVATLQRPERLEAEPRPTAPPAERVKK
jgi:hypothetical protein